MKPIIISAFPGKGKSYMSKSSKYKVIDSDSSKYSWIWKDSKQTNERNPNFIDDYMNHIIDKSNDETIDVIFVSSHKDVRDALAKRNIKYFLIYGHYEDKDDYLDLYKERGNSENFINNMKTNYYSYIENMDREKFPIKLKMHANEFITDDLVEKLIAYKDKFGTLEYALSNPTDQFINWTMISQNTKSWSWSALEKFGDKLAWDLVTMYGEVPTAAMKRYPVNKDYLSKFKKQKEAKAKNKNKK